MYVFESVLLDNLVRTFVTFLRIASLDSLLHVKIGRLFSKQPNRPLFTTTKANSIECLITTSQSSGVDGIFSGLGQPLIEADERRVKGRKLPPSFLPR